MKYRVVRISNNIEEYPDCAQDTKEFPHLIERVSDEMDVFIVADSGEWWPASEFFHMVDIHMFEGNDGKTY